MKTKQNKILQHEKEKKKKKNKNAKSTTKTKKKEITRNKIQTSHGKITGEVINKHSPEAYKFKK